MPLRLFAILATAAALSALAVVGSAATASSASSPPKVKPHPLTTAIYSHSLTTAIYPSVPTGATLAQAVTETAGLGAKMMRMLAYWANIAPKTLPGTWNPADPADPNYNWTVLDAQVTAAVAAGLTPYIDVLGAPQWAQASPPSDRSSNRPSPDQLGAFAEALARRYSGSVAGLPRVRYFQAWDEPNLTIYLRPQLVNKQPVSPDLYRAMVNAFAKSVHGVNPSNIVIAGALAPFRDITPDILSQNSDWGPLAFMRSLFCLSASLKRTCSSRVAFDVWAMNPYTSGGPTHHAVLPNDVSLGDLDKVNAILQAAEAHHTITAPHGVGFWVTEFSWDSNPPDPAGVPVSYLARWVPEALYTMWKAGVSVVTWYTIQDAPMATSPYQSGFYTYAPGASGDKKPYAQGFRFPFVAYPDGKTSLSIWGRSPTSRAGNIRIEQKVGAAWHRLATVRANASGIFTGEVTRSGSASVRATLIATGESSLPYALKEIPDHFFNPFGLSTPLEPKKK